ncbi:MAG: tRNA 2-thiouridine(34) synthase MnmA [Candidatus Moranbacteria bacterium]|nr:tRNA 2-thiouridine(34) synthase MnmA [Candidatus Moranbacteria bacterium]
MKIAMLISGGVDSSVALRLLKDAGHEVSAFYLKIWLEDELSFLGECPWEEDLKYVRSVCEGAGVPLEIVPFQKEYHERIVSYVIAEATAGRTPNPDVFCNTLIKFGAFVEAYGSEFDRAATGHYAHTEIRDGKARLLRSSDPVKDQTYFLSRLTPEQAEKAMFPIGGYRKEEVRKLAVTYALPNATRKDSQGICFLGKVPFDKFLEEKLGTREGDIVDQKTGARLGKHQGFWFYTIGQRKGIGLSGGPWYVTGKDTTKNIVYISNAYRSAETARTEFSVEGLSWIAEAPSSDDTLTVKLRHGVKEAECNLVIQDRGRGRVMLAEGDTGVAPGQIAAFYRGDECLGSGIISEEE